MGFQYLSGSQEREQTDEAEDVTDTSPGRAGRERIVDGRKYLRRTDYLGREHWYPVSQEPDPDEHVRTAALLGFLGIHRFREHRFGSGLVYILTFGGCFGVLPALDVITMMTGNYRLKDGSYLDRPSNLKKAALRLLCTAGIGVLLFAGFRFTAASAGQLSVSRLESETEDRTTEELLEEYGWMLSDLEEGGTGDEQ